MKKNCIWVCGLLLSALVLLVGCHGSDSPSGALRLSKETISITVGQEIALTRTGEGGAVEVMLPKGKDFALTVDNDQVAQVKGKTIKGVAPGKATVTVTAGAEHALLTVEVQAINKDQKVTLSPTWISAPVDRAIVFGAQEGAGVDVVVTTTPATDFTISTSDPDKVKVEGHKVTGLAVGTYKLAILAGGAKADFELIVGDKELTGTFLKSSGRKVLFVPEHLEDVWKVKVEGHKVTGLAVGTYKLAILAGGAKADFELIVGDKELTGTFLKSSGRKVLFVPEHLEDVWDRQELLKKMIESNTNYLFDHIDEEHKAIWFIDKNVKAGHMSMSYSHIVYVLNPKGSERPHLEAMYLDQPNGMFEFTYVGYISDLGFNVDQNNPPELQVDQEGNHYFEDVHPTLPYTVRIYYKTRINDEGDKVEDVYARLTPVVRM